jgi:NAD(P)-dependent dehydrogenase (short-subunit alcohol dehydrogenase family)
MSQARKWAVVLGASSGFGEATSLELARAGFDIAGVHLDRRSTMPNVERITAQIKEMGRTPLFFNVNAADEEARKKVVTELKAHIDRDGGAVHVLMHSLAFGTLRPYVADKREECVNQKQLEMTLDVMANSLVYWTQEIYYAGLFGKWARIYAMTSAGSVKVWPMYGPVSAAKAALESHIRQLAVEMGKYGITANSIMAGVTDTPALRKIPGNDKLIDNALKGNPTGRLTTTEDVARFITLLSVPETSFVTGNVLAVDGGELIV